MNRLLTKTYRYACLALSYISLFTAATGLAAGWDTPIIYTARHQGMGGTAIASVDDPSASYHNPAGYRGVQGLELLGNVSLLLGNITTSPGEPKQNLKSNLIVAPFPYFGVGMRVHEWVTLGFAANPVASGAAEYDYVSDTADKNDGLKAVFYELSPGLSINIPKRVLPGNLSFGAGYRITYLTFNRYQTSATEGKEIDQINVKTSGIDPKGFRVGFQYEPITNLKLGAVFRNKIVVDTQADDGVVNYINFEDISFDITLPAQAGAGLRYDLDRYSVAIDYQFTAQSQNDQATLSANLISEEQSIPTGVENISRWKNGHTLRTGLEYRLPIKDAELPLRLGYIWDARVANLNYPTGFGTPPAATSSVTGGLGYQTRRWQVNMAAAYRFGSNTVPAIPKDQDECGLCSYEGDYKMRLTGIYLDFSYEWDMGHYYN